MDMKKNTNGLEYGVHLPDLQEGRPSESIKLPKNLPFGH